MSWWQAIVLGIVEGVTEYLPVSSTGHLLVAQRLLGIESGEAANTYAICIQAGAILAVLGLYSARIRQIGSGVIGRDAEGRGLAINPVVAFLPAAVIGFVLDDWIESVLFGVWPIIFAWLVGGIGILWLVRRPTVSRIQIGTLSSSSAAVIGLAQCLAMWPGTSRSLVTIVAGLLVGLPLAASVEFAFLLGLLTLGAATTFKALTHGDTLLATYGISTVAIGFFAAWVSAAVAVRWMIGWLNRNGLSVFGYWRIGVAVAAMALLWS